MTNIVDIKIDLDDPKTWVNAEITLRNMQDLSSSCKKAGVEVTTDQLTQIVKYSNDKLPSIPVEDITSIPEPKVGLQF